MIIHILNFGKNLNHFLSPLSCVIEIVEDYTENIIGKIALDRVLRPKINDREIGSAKKDQTAPTVIHIGLNFLRTLVLTGQSIQSQMFKTTKKSLVRVFCYLLRHQRHLQVLLRCLKC